MKNEDLIIFMRINIYNQIDSCSESCTRIRRCALQHLVTFTGGQLPFKRVTPSFLKSFEEYLWQRELAMNTVSAYLRAVRVHYNCAVREGLAPFVHGLFKYVFTGVDGHAERALDHESLHKLATQSSETLSPLQNKTRNLFLLLFLLRGIPFVDLIFLRKCDIRDKVLTYRRRKTGKRITVVLTPEAESILKSCCLSDEHSPYLLPFIRHAEEDTYRQYQNALRNFNYHLNRLAPALKLNGVHLSSYVARHSWATQAILMNESIKLVSMAMGHSSVRVTENYLKQASDRQIDEMNRRVIAEVFR